jgi:hypothetical protein
LKLGELQIQGNSNHQVVDMNTTEKAVPTEVSRTTELSIEDLDAVAGGEPQGLVNNFVHGFLSTCPSQGYDSFRRAIGGCL